MLLLANIPQSGITTRMSKKKQNNYLCAELKMQKQEWEAAVFKVRELESARLEDVEEQDFSEGAFHS